MDRTNAMRERLIDQVKMMLARPGMFTSHDQAFECLCSLRLDDLRFLDDESAVTREESGTDRYGNRGVPGPFWGVFGNKFRCYNEVASVYAEIFHRYGYLELERRVPAADWKALTAAADSAYTEKDARLSDIMEEFGPPSFKVGRWVLCYAPDDGGGWIFFDGSDHLDNVYELDQGRFAAGYPEDPLLRSIRLPGNDFKASLRLTPHGKALQHLAEIDRIR